MKALGMIETYGCVAAVEALDSALKAANVSLLDMSRVKGGNVTVLIEGDVGAIKAAVSAAQASAASVGRVAAVHVIPRPAGDVGSMIETAVSDKSLSFFRGKQEILEEPEQLRSPGEPEQPERTDSSERPRMQPRQTEPEGADPSEQSLMQPRQAESEGPEPEDIGRLEESSQPEEGGRRKIADQSEREELESYTVEELRRMARALKVSNMTRRDIRFAKKQELIDEIMRHRKQEM